MAAPGRLGGCSVIKWLSREECIEAALSLSGEAACREMKAALVMARSVGESTPFIHRSW
jgi:hypothetical protein